MSWLVLKRPDQSIVHIIPQEDFEPHDETLKCRCEPVVKMEDDWAMPIVIHQPYDDCLCDPQTLTKNSFLGSK